MKLSEAIRLGAMMKPQAFGQFYNSNGTCAYGAACDAVGLDADLIKFEDHWPIVASLARTCHLCGTTPEVRDIDGGDKCMIVHLNDEHQWTREAIADWVEAIEATQPVEPAAVEVSA